MSDEGKIASAVLFEGNVVITLSDDSFILLTLDQLLSLGATRHRIPEGLRGASKPAET